MKTQTIIRALAALVLCTVVQAQPQDGALLDRATALAEARSGKWERAEAALEALAGTAPADPEVCAQLVLRRLEQKRHKEAVERAAEAMKAAGAKRALMLPVSAPFHSVLMQPAAAAMADALAAVDIHAPAVPVIANVRAEPVSEPGAIRILLVEQVTGSVRWRESIEFLAGQGVTEFWEIGAGKALSGMIKRISKDAVTRNIGTHADLAALKG